MMKKGITRVTALKKMVSLASEGRMTKIHTETELQKWSKAKLIRYILKLESSLLKIAIRLYKAKLPRLKKLKRKALTSRRPKRQFSAKQLAAQRLFAKRARAGTLRKRRRR